MKVDILSREYPPKVYGGAGVHAEELSKVLAERVDVTVRAFDGPRAENEIPEIPGDNPKGRSRSSDTTFPRNSRKQTAR